MVTNLEEYMHDIILLKACGFMYVSEESILYKSKLGFY